MYELGYRVETADATGLVFVPGHGVVETKVEYVLQFETEADSGTWVVRRFRSTEGDLAWVVFSGSDWDQGEHGPEEALDSQGWVAPGVVLQCPDPQGLRGKQDGHEYLLRAACRTVSARLSDNYGAFRDVDASALVEKITRFASHMLEATLPLGLKPDAPLRVTGVAVASEESTFVDEICDETGPVDWETHTFTSRWLRVAVSARACGRLAVILLEVMDNDVDASPLPSSDQEIVVGLLGLEGRVACTRRLLIAGDERVPLPSQTGSLLLDVVDFTRAEGASVARVTKVLGLLDQRGVRRLAKHHHISSEDCEVARRRLADFYGDSIERVIASLPRRELAWLLSRPVEALPGCYVRVRHAARKSHADLRDLARAAWLQGDCDGAVIEWVAKNEEEAREFIAKLERQSLHRLG